MSFWTGFKKVLKAVADFFIAGREMGLWSKGHQIQGLMAPRISVSFSWAKALWKGVRIQLIVSALLFISTFFGAFDEVREWTAYGVPEVFAILSVGLVEIVRNVVKQWLEAFRQLNG